MVRSRTCANNLLLVPLLNIIINNNTNAFLMKRIVVMMNKNVHVIANHKLICFFRLTYQQQELFV